MATATEIKALLAITCPWCGAPAGTKCSARSGTSGLRPTTLDAEMHDARWQSALNRGARVIPSETMLAASAARRRPLPERPW